MRKTCKKTGAQRYIAEESWRILGIEGRHNQTTSTSFTNLMILIFMVMTINIQRPYIILTLKYYDVELFQNVSALANESVSLNRISLYPTVFTDVIRIEPRDSENLPCFRMELFQCEATCKSSVITVHTPIFYCFILLVCIDNYQDIRSCIYAMLD